MTKESFSLPDRAVAPLALGGVAALTGGLMTPAQKARQGETRMGHLKRVLQNAAIAGALGGGAGLALDEGARRLTDGQGIAELVGAAGDKPERRKALSRAQIMAGQLVGDREGEGGAGTAATVGGLGALGLSARGGGARVNAVKDQAAQAFVNQLSSVDDVTKKSLKGVGNAQDLVKLLNSGGHERHLTPLQQTVRTMLTDPARKSPLLDNLRTIGVRNTGIDKKLTSPKSMLATRLLRGRTPMRKAVNAGGIAGLAGLAGVLPGWLFDRQFDEVTGDKIPSELLPK